MELSPYRHCKQNQTVFLLFGVSLMSAQRATVILPESFLFWTQVVIWLLGLCIKATRPLMWTSSALRSAGSACHALLSPSATAWQVLIQASADERGGVQRWTKHWRSLFLSWGKRHGKSGDETRNLMSLRLFAVYPAAHSWPDVAGLWIGWLLIV